MSAARTTRYYGIVTRLAGAEFVDDAGAAVDLTWVCAPHNPTGADACPRTGGARRPGRDRSGLRRVRRSNDLSGLVRERRTPSSCARSRRRSPWPAMRVGYILAPPELAPRLDALRPPASIGVHCGGPGRAGASQPRRDAGARRARRAPSATGSGPSCAPPGGRSRRRAQTSCWSISASRPRPWRAGCSSSGMVVRTFRTRRWPPASASARRARRERPAAR